MHVKPEPRAIGMLAIFEPRREKDQYNNDVTIISLPSYKYRMVHHSNAGDAFQKATIYASRGKFVRFKAYLDTANDKHTVELAGYSMEWRGNKTIVVQNPAGPVIDMLLLVTEHDEAMFVGWVLNTLDMNLDNSELWQTKEVLPAHKRVEKARGQRDNWAKRSGAF